VQSCKGAVAPTISVSIRLRGPLRSTEAGNVLRGGRLSAGARRRVTARRAPFPVSQPLASDPGIGAARRHQRERGYHDLTGEWVRPSGLHGSENRSGWR
jgi:hypothetical protein